AAINYLKKESTKENYVRQFLINLNEGSYQTSSSEDAHELVVHNELLESIESVVETLPEQCKTIFKMSRFRGMRNKEIAEVYSISPRTVETQLYRALKVLKENIKPNLAVTASLILIIIKSI
ncbi:MAG: sigma-70 family RNA polymerase sigma factor, partial [Cyclobacteriaceae bacterium]|nr:sigma-70 family RNA polymerase sigma factor [Cyclobacteriaceae bacterium]